MNQKIMVIGCGGAGKSFLSRRLHKITGFPLIHLEKEYWLPGWMEPNRIAWEKKSRELTVNTSRIMDGNYGSC